MSNNISEIKVTIGADASGLKREMGTAKQAIQTALDTKPIETANAALSDVAGKTGLLISRFNAVTTAAAGAFGLKSLIEGTVEAGDAVYKLSNRLNISAAEAGQLSRTLKLTGGDANTCASAMMRLDKSFLASGTAGENTRNTLAQFGVSLTDANGKMLPLNDQLANLAKGYKEAKEAGVQQEFLMNTLGVKGLALAQTLDQYAEAAETASKVKGIGLDPKQMHELNQQMKVMDMQAGQVKLAFTSALAPVAEDLFPEIINGLTTTATFLANNKTEIKEITTCLVQFIALYKSLQLANMAMNGAASFWQTMKMQAVESAGVQTTAQAEITAAQERQIARRVAAIERAAEREQAAVVRTVSKLNLSAEESAAMISEKCAVIAAKSAETAEMVASTMRAGFAAEAEAAAAAAVEANTALSSTAVAAAEMGTRLTVAHASAAESGQIATKTEMELALATTATGNAAVIAGEKNVAAKTETTIATAGATTATETLALANTNVGNTAAAAGARTVGVMATATTAVGTMTKAVWALAGGWLGVGAAIAYAAYCAVQFMSNRMAERKANTFEVDGQSYEWDKDNGTWTTTEQTQASRDAEAVNNPAMDYASGGLNKTVEVTDPEMLDRLNGAWFERHQNDDDYVAQLAAEAAQAEVYKRQAELESKMNAINTDVSVPSSNIGSTTAAPQKAPDVMHYSLLEGDNWTAQYANQIEYAASLHNIDPNAIAAILQIETNGDPDAVSPAGAIGLGQFMPETAAAYGINPHDPNESILGTAAYLSDLYHSFGSYELAAAGYNAGAGAVQQYGGVPPYQETQNYVAKFKGLYDGATSSVGPASDTASSADAAMRAEKQKQDRLKAAQKESDNLMRSMQNAVASNDGYDHKTDTLKAMQDILDKRAQITKLQQSGLPQPRIDALNKELDVYSASIGKKLNDKWQKVYDQMADDAYAAHAEERHDYEAMARAEYDTTVRKLADERKEKEKAVMRDKDDEKSKAAVSEWYYAQVAIAEEKRQKATREAHDKYISYLQDEGNLAAIIAELSNPIGAHAEETAINIDGQKELASEYVKLWKAAHGSMSYYIAQTADSMYSTLSDSMAEFVRGTKSAMNVLQDFGNSVLSMMAKIAAQRLAASWMTNILGAVTGGGTAAASPTVTSYSGAAAAFNKFMPSTAFPFADGGIVTAPTLGLVGEAGTNEAIIPLTDNNLRAMSGGGGKGGGCVVNITNKSDSKVGVASSNYDEALGKWVLNVVIDGASRDRGGFGTNLKTALGAK